MFWRMVGRWAVVAIAIPVGAVILRKIGESIERRKGPTRMSALLRRASSGLDATRGRRAVTAR